MTRRKMTKAVADAHSIRSSYETLEHTADIGIRVEASDARELFAKCACAMFDLMVDLPQVRTSQQAKVSLEAESYEDLMIAWLNELLFQADASGMFFGRFEVESVTEHSLDASVWGEPYEEARHSVALGVKAATYHGLEVVHSDSGWSATVIFDV